MKIKRSIVNFIIRSRPYLLGFVSGISISIVVVGVNAFKEPVIYNVMPPPFTDTGPNSDVHQMLLYGEGGITNRSDRYYHRGSDWIMIRDFGLNIDNYEENFKDISHLLWTK